MTVFTYNADARIAAASAELEGIPPSDMRIHLLPIPTKALTGNAGALEALLSETKAGDLVFGYGIPSPLADAMRLRDALTFDVEKDEIFISDNAQLTAEATMGYLLSEPRAPRDLAVGIIGYGRIGQALCRMLLFFGAQICVFTEREAVRTALGASDVKSRPIRYEAGERADFSGLDLVIQTAPAQIFTKENTPNCPIWNLAAAAFVGEGVSVRQLSALPAKVCYASGGRALTRAVLRGIEAAKIRNERINA